MKVYCDGKTIKPAALSTVSIARKGENIARVRVNTLRNRNAVGISRRRAKRK